MAPPLLLLLSENHFLRIGVKPSSCSSSSHAPGGGVDELTACCCVSPDKHKGKNHQIERLHNAFPKEKNLNQNTFSKRENFGTNNKSVTLFCT
jgi:hypothetical protein